MKTTKPWLNFGLGGATNVELVRMERPSKGIVDLTATADAGLRYVFEGSTNLTTWTWLGVRTDTDGSVPSTDRWATNLSQRFYRVSIP